jgi:uncharacterized membrane protein YfbV (UPF0208 family)
MAGDLITRRKVAFHRTPRRGESSVLSVQYTVVASLMVVATCWRVLFSGFQSVSGTAAALINISLIAAGWYLVRERPVDLATPAIGDAVAEVGGTKRR